MPDLHVFVARLMAHCEQKLREIVTKCEAGETIKEADFNCIVAIMVPPPAPSQILCAWLVLPGSRPCVFYR